MKILNLSNLSRKHIILLNKISVSIIGDYNSLIENVFYATDKSINWLVSSTLSRNSYMNPLFINLCYLQFVKVVMKKDQEIKKIIVPNKELKEVLRENFKRKNIVIYLVVSNVNLSFKERIKRKIRPLIVLRHISTLYVMWLLGRKKRKDAVTKDHPIILIDTFFLPSMFKNNRFNDRYYPGLLECLSEEETKSIFFTPEILIHNYRDLKKALEIAEKAKEQFIFRIDYLKIVDYLFAFTSLIKIKKIKFDNFSILEYNVGPLLKTHFCRNVLNGSSLFGLLNYRFFRRLKESGVKLRKVVDWNENQVIDRGFNKGLKDYYPNVPSVGYQGYIVSSDFNFHLHPTKWEVDSAIIPDEIAVVGKELVQDAKKYYKDLNVSAVPAFRFNGVWKEDITNARGESNIILVTLPISLKESEEIIKLTIDMLRIKKTDGLIFHIEPHPSLKIDDLKRKFGGEWPGEFLTVDGNFTECVKKSFLMFGNASSACVEALAMGIPVIIIGSQSGLTQNPIPNTISNVFWRLCYTPYELKDAVEYFADHKHDMKLSLTNNAIRIREQCFEPVTEKGVRSFLGLTYEHGI